MDDNILNMNANLLPGEFNMNLISTRPTNSCGSWEPSSKKEYELPENFEKIHALL